LTILFYFAVMYGIKFMSYKQEVLTPEIKGLSTEEAIKILHDNKLGMSLLEEQFSDDIEKGKIINQFPSSGIKLKVDRNVRVIISRGKEAVRNPDLIGKVYNSAVLTLDSFSLLEGDVVYVYSSDYKKDYVIAQNPESGSFIFKGDKVDLLLSKGEEERFYVMPDLIIRF